MVVSNDNYYIQLLHHIKSKHFLWRLSFLYMFLDGMSGEFIRQAKNLNK